MPNTQFVLENRRAHQIWINSVFGMWVDALFGTNIRPARAPLFFILHKRMDFCFNRLSAIWLSALAHTFQTCLPQNLICPTACHLHTHGPISEMRAPFPYSPIWSLLRRVKGFDLPEWLPALMPLSRCTISVVNLQESWEGKGREDRGEKKRERVCV